MLRHSAFCLTQEGVDLLASYFFMEEGEDAFPVLNSESGNLSTIEQNAKRAIRIPESLWTILSKSTTYNLADMMNNFKDPTVDMKQLKNDEMEVVKLIMEIVKETLNPVITMNDVSIVDSSNEKRVTVGSRGEITLSRESLDLDFIHKTYNPRCNLDYKSKLASMCYCRETHILTGLVFEYASKKGSRGYEKIMTEKLIQRLIARSCGVSLNKPLGSHEIHVGARMQRLQEENLQLEMQVKELKQKLELYK